MPQAKTRRAARTRARGRRRGEGDPCLDWYQGAGPRERQAGLPLGRRGFGGGAWLRIGESALDPTPPTCRPGDVLAGKYRVERVLGAGRHGRRRRGARTCSSTSASRSSSCCPRRCRTRRSMRRASSARRARPRSCASEHVARVLDVGTLDERRAVHGDGVPRGRGPRGRARRARARCPSTEAVDYVLQACEALAEAHALGHRPSRPQAGEPLPRAAARRHAAREGARLRHLEGRRRPRRRR